MHELASQNNPVNLEAGKSLGLPDRLRQSEAAVVPFAPYRVGGKAVSSRTILIVLGSPPDQVCFNFSGG